MIVKRSQLFFKHGYQLLPITPDQAENLELNEQAYCKATPDSPACPVVITKCFEGAEKFEVDVEVSVIYR